MQLLVFLVTELTAIGLIGAQLARKQSALANSQSMEECIKPMHVQHTNLKKILECMARSTNLTAFMEDTILQLDLLVHLLDKLETIQTPEVYIPSPYVHIDDVLKIKGSVTGYSCQGKQHVVQAIRRKLHQSHLMNGRKSTLFQWPSSLETSRTIVTSTAQIFDGKIIKKTDTQLDGVKELSCLISEAIERHGKPMVKNKLG